MRPYTDLNGLRHVYLEDSWVLDIIARPEQFEFCLDLVLTPDHPEYRPPHAGEQHCYRRGSVRFVGVKHLTWEDQGSPPAVDATDEVDYGNIDAFVWSDDTFRLEGSWGRAVVRADGVVVELVDGC